MSNGEWKDGERVNVYGVVELGNVLIYPQGKIRGLSIPPTISMDIATRNKVQSPGPTRAALIGRAMGRL